MLAGLAEKDRDIRTCPDPEWPAGVRVQDQDPHRDALRDLDPVPRGVLRREEREGRTASATDAHHFTVEAVIWVHVDMDVGTLTHDHATKRGLLKVGRHPILAARDKRKQRCTGLDIGPGPQAHVAQVAIGGRTHQAVREIEPRARERGLGRGQGRAVGLDRGLRRLRGLR